MARLNIYVPNDVHAQADRWRGKLNLSEICTRALRDEISAAESARITLSIADIVRKRSGLEEQLVRAFQLKDAVVIDVTDPYAMRDELGAAAAKYLDRWINDGARLAIAGGRQTWGVVRNLSPRNVRIDISALGYGQHDAAALHTHPNTLLTLAWLLYSPRARAHLVGSSRFTELWNLTAPVASTPKYFLLSSCSEFQATSPFADVLGKDASRRLLESGVIGDYAYTFFDGQGGLVDIPAIEPTMPQSVFAPQTLQALSERDDARTLLVAGGTEKTKFAAMALKKKLCNTLIVDSSLADGLLKSKER